MTTKPPAKIKIASGQSLERVAYQSVVSVPTVEPHDQDRLGYNVWKYLTERRDSLEVAVKTAGARLLISEEEALQRIRQSLNQQGIQV